MNRTIFDETIAAMFSNIEFSGNYLFYAHMIGQCSVKIQDIPAPAAVSFDIDHYNLYINPELFDKYPLVERLFILKHEMLHILYDHVNRKDDRDHMQWNIATDCAINQQDVLGHVPEKCITPLTMEKYVNMQVPVDESAEFYYKFFQQNMPESEPDTGDFNHINNQNSQDNQDPSENPVDGIPQTLDNHDMWEESVGDSELQKDVTKKMIEKAQEETIKGKGSLPSGLSELLKLHTRKSEVSWKKMLRNIVGNKKANKRSTIMRQARRFPKRSDLRGTMKDRVFNLLVIVDVSASMDDESLLHTLGEVQNICKLTNTELDLIQVDTVAFPPEKLTRSTKLITRKGNGGTDLHPALDIAKQYNIKYDAIVVLTDGFVWERDVEHFKNTNKKVIWLISKDGDQPDFLSQGLMKSVKL